MHILVRHMKIELLKDNLLLMDQYDYEKNRDIDLEKITTGSNKKIWWKCSKGHSFEQVVIKRRDHPYSCPYCSGKRVLEGFNDLATLFPDIASEWHPSKNDPLLPNMVAGHSNKMVWWKCNTCGHEWRCKVNDRANGRGCPECAKDKRKKTFRNNQQSKKSNLAIVRPDLLVEWDYNKNTGFGPEQYTCASGIKVWWKCSICGNEWKAAISNRASNNSNCPRCMKHQKTSFPEQALYYYIKREYPDAVNGFREIFTDGVTELDIYIPTLKVGIEYDGKAWHDNKRSKKKASEKYSICKKESIVLIRVSELKPDQDKWEDYYVYRESFTPFGLDETIKKTLSIVSKEDISVDTERDRSEIMKSYITVIRDRSITKKFPKSVQEWDIEKNNGITTDMVSATSSYSYWWRCKLGHSYKMSPANKLIAGHGCPICSNHKILSGFNDLATRYPAIAAEWDYEKNDSIKPDEVMPGSVKNYWWKCPKGHSYLASPNGRTANNSGCPYCSGRAVLVGYNDLDTTNPEVSALWDYDKNRITPKMVSAGSLKKVWWKCSKEHSWQKGIQSQVRFNNCPICDNRVVLRGYNDLSVTHPQLINDWDFEKNREISPYDITFRNTKKVWWKCSVCGAVWQNRIDLRAKGIGCPKCGYTTKMQATRASNVRKEKRDLVSCFPKIAAEWDYDKNQGLNPIELSPGSNHKVWWICSRGHSYQAWINDRTGKRKTGCPYCSGKRRDDNITVSNPELALEWDYEKNGDLKPTMFSRASNEKVWWKCKNNHSFFTQIKSRAYQHTGCPFCSNKKLLSGYNDLLTLRPDIAKEWHPYKNNGLQPSMVLAGSGKKVWWQCLKCGFEWQRSVIGRTSEISAGCPACARKKQEKRVKCIEKEMFFPSVKEAALWAGVTPSSITSCLKGNIKTCVGYHWQYVPEDDFYDML